MTGFARIAAAAFAGAALFCTPAMAHASDVLGKWDLVADTQMGQMKSTMTVSEGDGGYQVVIEDAPMEGAPAGGPEMQMESSISDVVVEGSEFSFTRQLKSPQFTMDLAYSGSVEGDSLSGKAGSDFGDSTISGTRAK